MSSNNQINFAEKLKSGTYKNKNLRNELGELVSGSNKELVKEAEDLATRQALNRTTLSEGGALGGLVSPKAMAVRAGATLGTAGRVGAKAASVPYNFAKKVIDLDNKVLGAFATA